MTFFKHETSESLVSYGIGAASIIMAHVTDIAQSATIIFGALLVIVRLIHDLIRLARYIARKE